jgi:hypothetical protein
MSDTSSRYGFWLTIVLCLAAARVASATPICGDVNDSGDLTVLDAQTVLKAAVGQDVNLSCAPACGDGTLDVSEQCEVGTLAGQTCATLGFAGGELSCAAGCTFDTSKCYATRFDASGETIIDHQTGLEWEKKDALDQVEDYENVHDADNYYTWASYSADNDAAPTGTIFLDMLARLNGEINWNVQLDPHCYADHCDWRLPSMAELQTIVIPYPDCAAAPCVVDAALEPCASTFYWSMSPDFYLYEALGIFFSNGMTGGGPKTLDNAVRAVRGTLR